MDSLRVYPFASPSEPPLRKILQGAIAGFIATAPMSISMGIGWRLLPKREKYHLPPRLITEEITKQIGLEDQLKEKELVGLTIFNHFGYGALFGALYALFEKQFPGHSSLKGGLAGLALWAGSYLGWLPALGLLAPATQQPWRRNLLMIVAHVIWGVTVGEAVRKLSASERNE